MNIINFVKYKLLKKDCMGHFLNLDFDMKLCDERVALFADSIYNSHKKQFLEFDKYSSKIGFFATELYDTGGHTPCLINLADSLYEDTKFPLFLSKELSTRRIAPKTISSLEKTCRIYGVQYGSVNFTESLIELYNKVINNTPQIVFLYIHQVDILMTSLIHLLKKNTGIKFVFFDHASHFPNLAMTMSDLIIEELSYTTKILTKKRHITTIPYRKCGLQSKKRNEVIYYSKEEIANKKKELGVKEDELLTVSGGTSYKYFDKTNTKSEHYEMIKRLLEQNHKLKHLAITDFNAAQEKVINDIFKDSKDARSRLIIHPLTSQWQILFQSADLFIDSFPISSAMTQIDLMSMKVPSVVKINLENIAWTFHEYMPENYAYMYEKVEDMERGILYLLSDKEELEKTAQNNYDFWLNNYESNVVKEKYLSIIRELI